MEGTLKREGRVAFMATALLLGLAACDGGSARSPGQAHAGSGQTPGAVGGSDRASAGYDRGYGGGYGQPDHRKDPVPTVAGKPLWAANKRHSAEDNAQYHFERDGPDFGAKTVDDYVAKAHAFAKRPPAGVLTLTRANGDQLFYDAHGNVFVVVTKDGAPRTMFKPRDGAAYWDQQKAREVAREDRATRGGGDDRGYGGERRYSRRARQGSGEDDPG